MDIHLAWQCYSVTMKLSSFTHFSQAMRVPTSKQVNALLTNRLELQKNPITPKGTLHVGHAFQACNQVRIMIIK